MSAPENLDRRTFAEFYPDPNQREQAHYAFSHQFLPGYVQQNPFAFFTYVLNQEIPGGPMDPTEFIQARWWRIFDPMLHRKPNDPIGFSLGFRHRCITDLSMSTHLVDNHAWALVKMPPPETSPQAFFVGIVLLTPSPKPETWKDSIPAARVFTLEKVDQAGDTRGILCEWTKAGTHRNYGQSIPTEPSDFLEAAAAIVRTSSTAISGTFKPATDPGPSATTESGGTTPTPPTQG